MLESHTVVTTSANKNLLVNMFGNVTRFQVASGWRGSERIMEIDEWKRENKRMRREEGEGGKG